MNLRFRNIVLCCTLIVFLSAITFFARQTNFVSKKVVSAAQWTGQEHLRDLSWDEQQGGHTLRRHVSIPDDELRDRLAREHISAASTYTDHGVAERVIGAALVRNQERIKRWMAHSGRHPNLVLDYHSGYPVGRTLRRGALRPEPYSDIVVVLKWKGPGQYYVLTSYPECR